ncbi:MAG: 50S ribosomal protein L18 [Candidatus Coatesbacteria bacterium]|nr:MAG: 50S ribosomal protein L18 [Candidatus Coatesbacteria bacterium]
MGHPAKKIRPRVRRHRRVRRKVRGTAQKPRVCVFRSLRHIYAQIVDDYANRTLAAASSLDPELRGKVNGGNVEGATAVGQALANRAAAAGIAEVVFDRGGYQYHGRVKALAEGAREGGLKF